MPTATISKPSATSRNREAADGRRDAISDDRRLPVRRGALCAPRRRRQKPSICHCRMCQKAFGSYLRAARRRDDRRFRGDARRRSRPSTAPIRSSAASAATAARRSPSPWSAPARSTSRSARSTSPRRCGRSSSTASSAVSPGSPSSSALPGETTEADDPADLLKAIAASNHQHPDHDTASGRHRRSALMSASRLTGGCQCGAVRFRVERASGAPRSAIAACARRRSAPSSAPLVTGHRRRVDARRAEAFPELEPGRAAASAAHCGTPLTYEYDGGTELAIGAFDDPSVAAPDDPGEPGGPAAVRRRPAATARPRHRRRAGGGELSARRSSATSIPTTTRRPGRRRRRGSAMSDVRLTGGCQCGAVRYAIHEAPYQVGVCHCRMCQKAVGAPFFATLHGEEGELRGDPRRAGSVQELAEDGARLLPRLRHAALQQLDRQRRHPSGDRPRSTIPRRSSPNSRSASRRACRGPTRFPALKAMTTDDIFKGYEALLAEIKSTNHQHPDHDTAVWPAKT